MDCTAPCAIAGNAANTCTDSCPPCRLTLPGSSQPSYQCYAYVNGSCDNLFGGGSSNAVDCSKSAKTPTPSSSPSTTKAPSTSSSSSTPTTQQGSSSSLGGSKSGQQSEQRAPGFFSTSSGFIVITIIAVLTCVLLVLGFLYWRRSSKSRKGSEVSTIPETMSASAAKRDPNLRNVIVRDDREQALLEGEQEYTPAAYYSRIPSGTTAVVPVQHWPSNGRGSDYGYTSVMAPPPAQRMSLSEKIKELQEQNERVMTGGGAIAIGHTEAGPEPVATDKLLGDTNNTSGSLGTVNIDEELMAHSSLKGDSFGSVNVDEHVNRRLTATQQAGPIDLNIDLYRLSKNRSSSASSMEL